MAGGRPLFADDDIVRDRKSLNRSIDVVFTLAS
jgi:hypothetical protein